MAARRGSGQGNESPLDTGELIEHHGTHVPSLPGRRLVTNAKRPRRLRHLKNL